MFEDAIKFYYFLKARKAQKLKKEDLERMQNRRLREIIRYAYKCVPAYRRMRKSYDIDIDKIRTKEDLQKLPVIDKKLIRDNYSQFISIEYLKHVQMLSTQAIFFRQTSGTTGQPLKLPFDLNSKLYLDAVYARALVDVGYVSSQSLLYYWWSMQENKWYSQFLGFFKKDFVPIEWSEIEQLKYMQNRKPKYLYYYPASYFSLLNTF